MKKHIILATLLIPALSLTTIQGFSLTTTQPQTGQPQQESRLTKLATGIKGLLGIKTTELTQKELEEQKQKEFAAQALSKHCGVKCQPGEKCCMPTYNGGYTTCRAQCPKGFVEV